MLILLRHAAALPKSEWDGASFDRPLSEEGKKQLAPVVRVLARQAKPDVVLTSPKERAKETAEMLAAATGAKLEVHDWLLDERPDVKGAAQRLGNRKEKIVAVVSHSDLLDDLFEHLTGEPLPGEGMPKAMAVAIDRPSRSASDEFAFAVVPGTGEIIDDFADLEGCC